MLFIAWPGMLCDTQEQQQRTAMQRNVLDLQRSLRLEAAARQAAEKQCAEVMASSDAVQREAASAVAAAEARSAAAVLEAERRQAYVDEDAVLRAERTGEERMRVRYQLKVKQAREMEPHTSISSYFEQVAQQHASNIMHDLEYAVRFDFVDEQDRVVVQVGDVTRLVADMFFLLPRRPIFTLKYVCYCAKCGAILEAKPGDEEGRGNRWSIERFLSKNDPQSLTDHSLPGACSKMFKQLPM